MICARAFVGGYGVFDPGLLRHGPVGGRRTADYRFFSEKRAQVESVPVVRVQLNAVDQRLTVFGQHAHVFCAHPVSLPTYITCTYNNNTSSNSRCDRKQ